MPYDLHTHSLASDGTTSPAEVVRAAAAAGLRGIALTDHDTGAGLAEAREEAERVGLELLPGVEISTSVRGRSVHLLAYGDVTTDPRMADVLAGTVTSRQARLERIVGRLQRVVPSLGLSDVLALVPTGVTPGRPHIADALVAVGAVADRDEAFVELLSEHGPYYVAYSAPALHDTVRLVRDAGGVPVVAHPGSRSAAAVLDDEALADLAGCGLLGLEVDHRDHDEVMRRRLRGLAEDLDLVVTGASDFHGAGKQNVMGENTTASGVMERIRALLGVRATPRPGGAG